MTPKRRRNLERLFQPRHITFIGGSSAAHGAAQCRRSGYTGTIWGVNPKRGKLGGEPCFPTVADLPEAPDAVFLAMPREHAVETVADLAEKDAGAVVSYTAGFGEIGGDGAELEARLIQAAGDLAFVGPNCLGVLNYVANAHLWPFDHGGRPVARGIGFVSQSGMLCTNLTMNRRHADFAYLISIGNQAVLRIEDVIDVMIDDDAVTAIGLYIEALKNVPRFAEVAARALAAGKPIVALKVGRSEIGKRMTISHTGSLSGSDELYDALFRRVGVIRVESPTALLETLKMLSISGAPGGRRMMAFTCSGGDSGMLADLGDRFAMTYNQPAGETAKALRAVLPPIASVANPLDYTTPLWGNEEGVRRVIETALTDPCDAALMAQDHPRPELGGTNENYRADTRAFIAATRNAGIPAVVCSGLPENIDEETRDLLVAGGVTPLQGIDEAMAAIDAACRWGARRASLAQHDDATGFALAGLVPIPDSTVVLDEWEGKQQLAKAGLAVPKGRLTDAEGAPKAANAVGYPVVVKLVSVDLPHKTEAGAVKVGLDSPEAVRQAVMDIAASVAAYAPGIDTGRFLIEAMAPKPVAELLVGVRRDPAFGPALTIAGGGVPVELLRDATTLLLPASRGDIAEALAGLKVAQLIAGYRGGPAGNLDACLDAIEAVASFAVETDTLVELDVNPLMVGRERTLAVDALFRIAAG